MVGTEQVHILTADGAGSAFGLFRRQIEAI
jgi:hypothetical protein